MDGGRASLPPKASFPRPKGRELQDQFTARIPSPPPSIVQFMGKNKAIGGGGGGGVGGVGGTPTLTLEQFADSLVGGGGGGGGKGGPGSRGGGKGGKGATTDADAGDRSAKPEDAVEVARWDVNPRVHLLRFKSAAAQRDAMVGTASLHLFVYSMSFFLTSHQHSPNPPCARSSDSFSLHFGRVRRRKGE